MPYIEDIRVNGQQTSITSPTIAGLYPVISWDYIEDEASLVPYSFEIRIGTSAVDWGTDEYSGDVISTSLISGSNFYEYSNTDLNRGITYYGQVQVTDSEEDTTPWKNFSFITNNLPFVTNFSLSPTNPTSVDNLELSYTFNDVDNHEESGTKIRWYKNNILVDEYNDLCILSSTATLVDESWTVKIIPCDGLEFGAVVETSSVTIQDVDTPFQTAEILPLDGNVNDILKVEYTLTETEYIASSGTVNFSWYVNSVEIPDTNNQYVRLNLEPGDSVTTTLTLIDTEGSEVAQAITEPLIVSDVDWTLKDLTVDELREFVTINDLTPILEWNVEKNTAEQGDLPEYFRAVVTKTPSLQGALYDTGEVQYTKNSFAIPENVLQRGQTYHVHVGASDNSPIPSSNYLSQQVETTGSSWSDNVSNTQGWTIETKVGLVGDTVLQFKPDGTTTEISTVKPEIGMHIHDGTYFCSITFAESTVTFHSDESVTYTLPSKLPDNRTPKVYRISGKGNDVKVYMNNQLIINSVGTLTNESQLKKIEYGDISGKYLNKGIFSFFRYSTLGAFGFGDSIINENVFYFHEVGKLSGGSIQYVHNNLIAWLPDDTAESSKLIEFNENSSEYFLSTVATNYSPITCIYVDEHRNKYIGTPNGANAIYGEKHDPDYEFDTSDTDVVITSADFDRITTLSSSQISLAEPNNREGWFTIDSTFRSIGENDLSDRFQTGDPYDPYRYGMHSHAIHYYTQRSHGHSWYDNVDNEKGWQISFTFDLDLLEHDDYVDQNTDHKGFGVFINDGTYQEIVFFYEDRIRLFYANVFVPIVTTTPREYRIVGKGNNLLIYQKLDIPSVTFYQLVVNGTGLFTTLASATGNSRKPRIAFDSSGLYHSVWHDDGNNQSQLFYSVYDGQSWSNPELIAKSQFNIRNPDISVDSSGRIWVAYEDTSWGDTEISVSVRDSAGWNSPTRITNYRSKKGNPAIIIDGFDNVHLVWEDDRNGNSEIYWAQRKADKQAWISSAQFGEDTSIMSQNDENNPYISGMVSFKNPRLAYLHPYIWVVASGNEDENRSAIYTGLFDVEENDNWSSIGVPIFNDDGEFLGKGISSLASEHNKMCVNPDICANDELGKIVIVWEDQTEPVSQIWGSTFNGLGTQTLDPSQITSRSFDCKKPTCGFSASTGAILFESNNGIYLSSYNSSSFSFVGSHSGDSDILLQSGSDRIMSNPAIAKYVPSTNFMIVYDYTKDRDGSMSDVEFPDFSLIGDASVSLNAPGYPLNLVTTSLNSEGTVSNLDTREFAFGDMSENTGILAHWKNIQFYFGYDAKPVTIGSFNSNTVPNWGDDRINDLFVDTFGNLVVAKFDGLVYHNVFTGELTALDDFKNKLVTSVKWGGNGAWFVGTNDGLFLSTSAGQTWTQFAGTSGMVINHIDTNSSGNAICASDNGIIIAQPDATIEFISIVDIFSTQVPSITNNIRTIAVDENDIIWVGTDVGLGRIESKKNGLFFSRKDGLRSSYVTNIAVVNKHLRFIATAGGIDRMHGSNFSNLNTQSHNILSNNISCLKWVDETQSLWVASMYALHEIVFRDAAHEIIENETVQYDTTELLTEDSFEKTVYSVLDLDEFGDIDITTESVTVFLNDNPVDFGFVVGNSGKSIVFLTELLPQDNVRLLVSNKFLEHHDFNQTDIEKRVVGEKRTIINKIIQTIEKAQNLYVTQGDKNQILLDGGETNLPYTSVLLDRDLPFGSIEHVDTLSTTVMRFKIIAFDEHSGIDGYELSNYENFTTDGDTPLEFQSLPSDGIVTHSIGDSINNVITSLSFPSTTTINSTSETVGPGSALSQWTAQDSDALLNLSISDLTPPVTFLYAATSSPPIIWRFNPGNETWTSIAKLGTDNDRVVTKMKEINNILYVATGVEGGVGTIYKTSDGDNFQPVLSSSSGEYFNGIAASSDGTVYFGDSAGTIYSHNGESSSLSYQNIGDSINSLDVWQNLIVAATGNKGRIYVIDNETTDNFVVFSGNDTDIGEVHIQDTTVESSQNAMVYAGSGDFTTIYRGNLDTFDFIKSFSSANKDISRIITVNKKTIDSSADDENELQTIAAVGDSLFKHQSSAWEFFFRHDENINDVFSYGSPGILGYDQPATVGEGIYLISSSQITKWTNVILDKKIYLRLRDKAGNVTGTPVVDPVCPAEDAPEGTQCWNFAYSINIKDLQTFINESRIVDIDEYGTILFTHDSPNDRSFYSADEIDEEIGTYTSEILNGSNDLVSWKTITWDSTEPTGTSVNLQIRYGVTEDETSEAEWTSDLVTGADGFSSIEHITDQYIQFRAILRSRVRDISPTLTSVTLRNLTTQASHFFTTNFIMPSRVVKGILTANTFVPVSSDVVFGINTKNSTDFGDYQIIEPNRVFTTTQGQFGEDFRIGAKLLSPAIPQLTATSDPDNPYDASSYTCSVDFTFTNTDVIYQNFHFRIRFYNDIFRTQLIHTFFSGNDQTGWSYGSGSNNFPATGITVGSLESATVSFEPLDNVESNQKWYITIESYDSSTFDTLEDNTSYICSACNIVNESNLISEYYLTGLPETLTSVPQFSSFTPDYSLLENNISFSSTFDNWVTSKGQTLSGFVDNFAARFIGKIQAPVSGLYTFELQSSDGSILFIDGEEIINHDGTHGFTTATGSVNLTEGFHDIIVHYFDGTSDAGLELRWIPPGDSIAVVVPYQRLFHAVASEYCNIDTPRIFNLGMLFELDNGETVKINLTP